MIHRVVVLDCKQIDYISKSESGQVSKWQFLEN